MTHKCKLFINLVQVYKFDLIFDLDQGFITFLIYRNYLIGIKNSVKCKLQKSEWNGVKYQLVFIRFITACGICPVIWQHILQAGQSVKIYTYFLMFQWLQLPLTWEIKDRMWHLHTENAGEIKFCNFLKLETENFSVLFI